MQGVVEILINHFTSNLPRNLSVKKFGRSVKNHQNYGHEFVDSLFWPTLYIENITEAYLKCHNKYKPKIYCTKTY